MADIDLRQDRQLDSTSKIRYIEIAAGVYAQLVAVYNYGQREIATADAISGQKTVTTAGTAVALGTAVIEGPLAVKAKTTNTGIIYIGNDGTGNVSSTTGYPLAAGDVHIFDYVATLAALWINSAVNGEGVAWSALDV